MKISNSRNITVCGTDINLNSAVEMTWALIFGLTRNMKLEIDNMFQGYWQTSIGLELKGKRLGLIGLGKIGSQVGKIAKSFGADVPFLRPASISKDKSTDLEFMTHLIEWLKINRAKVPEFFVHLRPTTPLRETKIIDKAISQFKKRVKNVKNK